MFFLTMHLVDSRVKVRRLTLVVLGMGLFEAAIGMYQFWGPGRPRPTGTFFNANFFATYEAAVFSVALGLLLFRPKEATMRWERPFLALTIVVAVLVFIMAQSRGAILAFTAAAAVVGLYRFGKIFLAALLIGFLAIAVIPNPLQHRILTVQAQDTYAYTRLAIWENSLRRVADHPWGAGLGMYKYTSFQYRFPLENEIVRFGKRAESAHNEYAQMAVELGIPGLMIFLAGMGVLAYEVREALAGDLPARERGLIIGLAGGLVAILAHAAVDSVFHEPALVLMAALFAGLIVALKRLRDPERAPVWTIPFTANPVRLALVWVMVFLAAVMVVQPAAARYVFENGQQEMAEGRAAKALAWYERASRIDPGTSGYYDAAAEAEFALFLETRDPGRLRRAVEELQVGLELNALDARLAGRLGNLMLVQAGIAGKGPEREAAKAQAAMYYEQAIRLDPYSPRPYFELGRLHWTKGRTAEAQALFEQARKHEPNYLPVRLALAELFLENGRKEAARTEYDEIVRISERYRGLPLNTVERKFLEVDDPALQKLRVSMEAS